jgi:large subunit ribosomal protein L13
MTQKTFIPKSQTKADKQWYLVDAQDQIVGRLATKIADILRGKNKPQFTPHMDMGDYVVVINAEKVRLTGNKENQKEFIHHTGYLGHLRRKPFQTVREKNPKQILEEAVSGMLPKNRLRKHQLNKLMIFAGEEHPHTGQNPTPITL